MLCVEALEVSGLAVGFSVITVVLNSVLVLSGGGITIELCTAGSAALVVEVAVVFSSGIFASVVIG